MPHHTGTLSSRLEPHLASIRGGVSLVHKEDTGGKWPQLLDELGDQVAGLELAAPQCDPGLVISMFCGVSSAVQALAKEANRRSSPERIIKGGRDLEKYIQVQKGLNALSAAALEYVVDALEYCSAQEAA